MGSFWKHLLVFLVWLGISFFLITRGVSGDFSPLLTGVIILWGWSAVEAFQEWRKKK